MFESRDRKDRKYNAGGKLIESKTAFYSYDEEGFLIEKKEKSGKVWKYEWNTAGMLQRVVRPDKAEVHFKYDALGRRLEKQYKKTITKFIWDGNKPLHEWKEFDAKEATADELITWVFNEDDFAPAAKIKGEKKYSIVTDHLGTPVQGYNETGELIWDRELDSYGKIRMLKGDEGFCNYLYQGQTLDAETGLAYNRFRYYDPEEGRYVSQDPIGIASNDPNFYAYVYDVNRWIDPLGLSGCASSNLPRLKGKKVSVIEKILQRGGFIRTQHNNNNQTWKHADGSEVRIHRHGNQNEHMQNGDLTPKSGLNAHIHKEDPQHNQLNDRGQIRNPQTHAGETHIGIKNPSTLPAVRGRPHGHGA